MDRFETDSLLAHAAGDTPYAKLLKLELLVIAMSDTGQAKARAEEARAAAARGTPEDAAALALAAEGAAATARRVEALAGEGFTADEDAFRQAEADMLAVFESDDPRYGLPGYAKAARELWDRFWDAREEACGCSRAMAA